MTSLGLQPVLIMASPLPISNDGRSREMIMAIERKLVYDIINPYNDARRLHWMYNSTEEKLKADMIKHLNLWDLICDRVGC